MSRFPTVQTRILAALAATALLSGCASMHSISSSAADQAHERIKEGNQHWNSGDFRRSAQSYRDAREAIVRNAGRNANGRHNLYRSEALTYSMEGHALFQQGEFARASELWREAITVRHNGLQEEQRVARTNNSRKSMVYTGLAVLGTLAIGTYAAQGGVNTANSPQLQQLLTDYNMMMLSAANNLPPARSSNPDLQRAGSFRGDPVRVATTPDAWPFSTIGRIVTPGSFCTGVAVGARVVLTNLHCVVDRNLRALSPSQIGFRIERVDQTSFRPYRVVEYFTDWGRNQVAPDNFMRRNFGSRLTDVALGSDWAVLVLDSPVSNWIALAADTGTAAGSSVMIAGYSGDINDGTFLSLHYNCRLRSETRYIDTNCHSAGGSSGAPILTSSPPFRVIGLNAGGTPTTSVGPHAHRSAREVERLNRLYPAAR